MEEGCGRRVPERSPHSTAHHDRRQRLVTGAESLGAGHEVGSEAVALAAEPPTETPESGDHLVAHEEDVTLAADVGDRGPVAVRRWDDPARSDHRLAEERGHTVAELVEGARQIRRVVVCDLGDVADEGPVTVTHRRDPGERRAVRVRAVVGEAA